MSIVVAVSLYGTGEHNPELSIWTYETLHNSLKMKNT
jgi:hypothetical protein